MVSSCMIHSCTALHSCACILADELVRAVAAEALSLGCVGILLREGAFPAHFDADFQLPISLIFSAPSSASQRRRVSDE